MVSYTSNKKLNKPANGEYPDTWDVPINEDWDIIDKALGGAAVYTVAASDITMTISEAQNLRIVLTGTPGATRTIYIPFKYLSASEAVGGMWLVDNQTNATQNIVTEVTGSIGVAVGAGRRFIVYSDGTNVYYANDARITAGTGITVSGSTVSLSVPVSVSNGGTGWSSLVSNGVLLGNGTGAIQAVAPSTAGYVLTTDGSTWYAAPSTGGGGGGGGITSITFAVSSGMGLTWTPGSLSTPGGTVTLGGTLAIANGGTGTATIGSGIVSSNGAVLSGGYQVDLSGSDVKNTLPITRGGTGSSSFTAGLVKYVSATNNLVGGQSVDLSTSDATGILPFSKGGTGVSTLTAGFVKSNGAAFTSQSSIDLSGSDVSNTLPVARGGTGVTSYAVNGAVFSTTGSSLTSGTLPVNAGGTGAATFTAGYLKANGTTAFTSVSGIAGGDINSGVVSTQYGGTGANLISATAGFVKLSTGVMSTSATVNLSSEVTGTLAVARGGTNITAPTANGAVYVNAGGSAYLTGTLPVASGGTGVTTSTGTGSVVLNTAPQLTGNVAITGTTSTFRINTASALSVAETVSVVAPTTTDAIVAKVSTDTQNVFVGQNSTGVENFSVTGAGLVTAKTSAIGSGTSFTTAANKFTNTNDWAIEATVDSGVGAIAVNSRATGNNFIGWYYNNTNIANIVNNGTSVSYNTTSDYRLKEDVQDYNDGLTKINALRPVTFEWKATPEAPRSTGFLAHEVQAVIPQAVNGEKDAVNPDGSIKPQGMDTSFIVPDLVSAVKTLTAKVQELEARVAALEAK